MKTTSLLLAFFITSTTLFSQYWRVTEKSPMPERVANNAAVEGFINGVPYLYSFGGIDSTKAYTGIHLRSYRLNIQTDIWESIPPLPDTLGKIAAAASRIGDIIYIIGGYHVFPGEEISSNRVHRYDIINNVYLEDGAPIPIPIDDQVQAVWRDSLIYVVAGWSGDGNSQGNVTNVQIYNPASDEWTAGSFLPNSDLFKTFGASGTIIGDTIFYYGGAAGVNFGITGILRKGIINPNNPNSVGWLALNGDPSHQGYRMAATSVDGNPYWLGGSANTYNFDGDAYDGSGGVPPANRSLLFDLLSKTWLADLNNNLPMDLRGIGEISDTVKYLAGGMLDDQWVSDKTYFLERSFTPVIAGVQNPLILQNTISLFPNPTSGLFEIQLSEGNLSGDLEIFDLNGIRLMKKELEKTPEFEVDLTGFPNGMYLLKIGNVVRRIVKMD